MGKAYTRRPLGRSGGACRLHHVDVGRAARDFTNPNTTTTTPDDLKCTNQPAAHQPLPPRSLNQLRRLLRPPTRDLEEGRGAKGLGGIHNSADERGQPSPLPRSRPDVTAGAYQAPTGPTGPKWVRAAPAATLQHVGRQSRHHPHPPMPRHHHQSGTPPHIGPPARSNPDGAQKGPNLGGVDAASQPHHHAPCSQRPRRRIRGTHGPQRASGERTARLCQHRVGMTWRTTPAAARGKDGEGLEERGGRGFTCRPRGGVGQASEQIKSV